jgi:hypothetical protein
MQSQSDRASLRSDASLPRQPSTSLPRALTKLGAGAPGGPAAPPTHLLEKEQHDSEPQRETVQGELSWASDDPPAPMDDSANLRHGQVRHEAMRGPIACF